MPVIVVLPRRPLNPGVDTLMLPGTDTEIEDKAVESGKKPGHRRYSLAFKECFPGTQFYLHIGVGGGSVLGMNVADGVFLRRVRRGKKLLDSIEENGDFLVVLLDLAGPLAVRGEELAEPDEGAHDGEAHLNGTITAEHGAKHGNTLLGEGVRQRAAKHAARRYHIL